MKWFKHYTNAHNNAKFQAMMGVHGIEGYAFIFLVYELIAEQYDGDSDKSKFVFNWVTLQNKLRMKRKRVQNQFRTSSELDFWKAECNDHFVTLECPKFVELRHKDASSSKLRKKSGPPQARLDKEEDKDKKKIKNKKKVVFDFDAIYQQYPLKKGKQKGLEKCKAQIKTDEDFEKLKLAIARYTADCVNKDTEPRYIKHFDTFMTTWRDWLDADVGVCGIAKRDWMEDFMEKGDF